MANSDKEQKIIDQLKHKTSIESPKVQEPSDAKPILKHKSFIITGMTFIIALLALIFAGYTIQLNKQLQIRLNEDKKNVDALLDKVQQNQSTNTEKFASKTDSIQQNQNDLQEKLNQLEVHLQTAMSQRLYQNKDWLLLKARYYLELAQINAHWSDSYTASVALLQEADKLLKQINDQKVLSIRQAIAKEIIQLKDTPAIDIAGVLSQLDAAQSSVTHLTIQSTINESEPEEENKTPQTSNPSTWRARLQDSVGLLEKLVVIRRDNEDFKPLLSPLFESILRESICLNLQEAQWAVLNNNPVVYQLALKQAILNLKRTFNEEAQGTSILIKQLTAMQQIKLNQAKPDIGLALPLLNQMIDSNASLVKETAKGSKGENL